MGEGDDFFRMNGAGEMLVFSAADFEDFLEPRPDLSGRMEPELARVASYNPWVALHWLVTGKTVGGTPLYPERNRLERAEALRLYTVGSS